MIKETPSMVKSMLGPLEGDVLNTLINEKEAHAKEIYAKLKKKRKIALTSVCVMLDRLFQKGLVTRRTETCKGGYRYLYQPRKTKEDYEKAVIDDTVKHLMKKFGTTAVAYFNDKFGKK